MDDKDWELFKKKLNERTGIDLQLYKEPQMRRRIGNLVTRAEMNSFSAYFDKVSKSKSPNSSSTSRLTSRNFSATPTSSTSLKRTLSRTC